MKICRGDRVVVVSGKDSGKVGLVTKALPRQNYVYVEGIGLCKKAVKPNPSAGIEGGLVSHQRPIHVSNVVIFNDETNSRDKVKYTLDESGKKIRVYKSNSKPIVSQSSQEA